MANVKLNEFRFSVIQLIIVLASLVWISVLGSFICEINFFFFYFCAWFILVVEIKRICERRIDQTIELCHLQSMCIFYGYNFFFVCLFYLSVCVKKFVKQKNKKKKNRMFLLLFFFFLSFKSNASAENKICKKF